MTDNNLPDKSMNSFKIPVLCYRLQLFLHFYRLKSKGKCCWRL